jgi:uncharacterized Rmd1/YagE family protein
MQVKAIQVGRAVNLKRIESLAGFKLIAKDPHLYRVGKGQFVVAMRYGVLVFWGVDADKIVEITKRLNPFIEDSFDENHWESIDLKVSKRKKAKVFDGTLYCCELTKEIKQLVSVVLSRSTVLEFFEKQTGQILSEYQGVLNSFHETGKAKATPKKLLKLVGSAMKIKNTSVHQLSMLEKPDFVWDDAELDLLYEDLEEEYEISSRYVILKEKLGMLFEDSEFILNYIDGQRAFVLELTIVILIVMEVILFVYEIWWN